MQTRLAGLRGGGVTAVVLPGGPDTACHRGLAELGFIEVIQIYERIGAMYSGKGVTRVMTF